MCDALCPNKKELCADVSISGNTVADWACEMATDLKTQLIEKGKYFVAYSLVVGETTGTTTNTTQLAIFSGGVDSNLFVMEEILDIKSVHGTTTGKNLFGKICQSVTDMKLSWDKLTTDRASDKSGLECSILLKMQEENCFGDLTTYHCVIHQETLCVKVSKKEQKAELDLWKLLDEYRSNTAVDVIECSIMQMCNHMELTMFSVPKSHASDGMFGFILYTLGESLRLYMHDS
eukprot:XP_014790468.1 PREDICTED: general transcription factor II-I repeat domain-containing protein 2-like [Octopus bimaculoides]